MDDSIKVLGNLEIIKRDKSNNIVETRTIPNLVVTTGKAAITQRMVHDFSDSNTTIQPFGGTFGRMAIGTSGTAAQATDGDGGTGVGLGSTEIQSHSPLQNVIVGSTVTYTAVFAGKGDGVSHGIKEAGIFNSPTANTGTMLCRTTFSEISKGSSDSLTINWNITIA